MCAVHEPCLRLRFLNVGDGDAALVEEHSRTGVFRMLVDTGRPDVGAAPGSLRRTAREHLRALGIGRIDMLVITHLHVDHFGGLAALLSHVSFADAYAGFIPPCPGRRVPPRPGRERTVEKLAGCLDQWAADTEALAAAGCRLHQAERTLAIEPADRLRVEVVCPSETAAAFQRAAWSGMLAGESVPDGMQHWSAKYRNPGSLRVRLTYAGRTAELAGDCYGAAWEDQARPCDIFKVPHHGDGKALTAPLAERLRPAYAVISCGADYIPRKDRPSRRTAEMLERQKTEIFFTDSFSASWRRPEYRRSVDFIIQQDGSITPPGRQT